MSLIHHAMCQQTYMESISNLFNEKQLSSKLEARKSLKTIWACMFWLCNTFLVKWLVRGHVFETTQGRHISPEGRQNQCVPTQGLSAYSNCRDFKECVHVAVREAGLVYSMCVHVGVLISSCVCARVLQPLTRGPSSAQQAATLSWDVLHSTLCISITSVCGVYSIVTTVRHLCNYIIGSFNGFRKHRKIPAIHNRHVPHNWLTNMKWSLSVVNLQAACSSTEDECLLWINRGRSGFCLTEKKTLNVQMNDWKNHYKLGKDAHTCVELVYGREMVSQFTECLSQYISDIISINFFSLRFRFLMTVDICAGSADQSSKSLRGFFSYLFIFSFCCWGVVFLKMTANNFNDSGPVKVSEYGSLRMWPALEICLCWAGDN